jgi:hypothetical protein
MQRQERQESGVEEEFVMHNFDCAHFIINLHALHNMHFVRRFLPRPLTTPQPWIAESDRKTSHDQMAARLRTDRAKWKAKNKENRQKRAAEKSQIQDNTLFTTAAKRQQL